MNLLIGLSLLVLLVIAGIVGVVLVLNDRRKNELVDQIDSLQLEVQNLKKENTLYERTLMKIGAGSETAALDAQDAIGMYSYNEKELNR